MHDSNNKNNSNNINNNMDEFDWKPTLTPFSEQQVRHFINYDRVRSAAHELREQWYHDEISDATRSKRPVDIQLLHCCLAGSEHVELKGVSSLQVAPNGTYTALEFRRVIIVKPHSHVPFSYCVDVPAGESFGVSHQKTLQLMKFCPGTIEEIQKEIRKVVWKDKE
jgi:hypothetical protein